MTHLPIWCTHWKQWLIQSNPTTGLNYIVIHVYELPFSQIPVFCWHAYKTPVFLYFILLFFILLNMSSIFFNMTLFFYYLSRWFVTASCTVLSAHARLQRWSLQRSVGTSCTSCIVLFYEMFSTWACRTWEPPISCSRTSLWKVKLFLASYDIDLKILIRTIRGFHNTREE